MSVEPGDNHSNLESLPRDTGMSSTGSDTGDREVRGASGGGDAQDLLVHSHAGGGHSERGASGGAGGLGVDGGMVRVQYNSVAEVAGGQLAQPPAEGGGRGLGARHKDGGGQHVEGRDGVASQLQNRQDDGLNRKEVTEFNQRLNFPEGWKTVARNKGRKDPVQGRRVLIPNVCFKCLKEGHFARDCSEKTSGVKDNVRCVCCGDKGHFASECSKNAARGNRGGCFRCGETGHQKRDCKKSEEELQSMGEINVEIDKEDSPERGQNVHPASLSGEASVNHTTGGRPNGYSPAGRLYSTAVLKSMRPQERVEHLLDEKPQRLPILIMKFEAAWGVRLVENHIEIAAQLVGLEDGAVLGMLFRGTLVKLLLKGTDPSLYCTELKQQVAPGVHLTWARHGEERLLSLKIKGADWETSNKLLAAYLSVFGELTPEGIIWEDQERESKLAGQKENGTGYRKLASGERVVKLKTRRNHIPKTHITR